ncbi:MAG TPA: nitroreductase family protein [Thermoanaerobaculia bacterium]
MTHAELHALLSERRSVRRFKADPPPRELIESLIASAVTAPSASNKQPWRFLVVQRRALIETMADAVRAAVDRLARAIDPAFEEAFRAYGDYFTRFEHAPLTIVPLFRPLTLLSNMLPDQEPAIRTMERDSGLIGASLAMQNLLLAAHAAGLGASGMTGPLVAVEELRALLHVPPSWEIAALVPVGYPDETPPPTARKAAERVTQWLD